MAYKVTAPNGVTVLVPFVWIGRKQLWDQRYVTVGFKLPDGVKPEAITHLLANSMIEAVPDDDG